MRIVPIRMSEVEIEYINKQKPNRSEFVRRLIHQHMDLDKLHAFVSDLRGQREGEGDVSPR